MRNRPRRRLAYVTWPRPRIVLTDTPRPDCPDCYGRGGYLVGSPGAEEPDDVPCECWDPSDQRTVCPIPRPIARRLFGYTPENAEPPF